MCLFLFFDFEDAVVPDVCHVFEEFVVFWIVSSLFECLFVFADFFLFFTRVG